jgi:hypothetical protein
VDGVNGRVASASSASGSSSSSMPIASPVLCPNEPPCEPPEDSEAAARGGSEPRARRWADRNGLVRGRPVRGSGRVRPTPGGTAYSCAGPGISTDALRIAS